MPNVCVQFHGPRWRGRPSVENCQWFSRALKCVCYLMHLLKTIEVYNGMLLWTVRTSAGSNKTPDYRRTKCHVRTAAVIIKAVMIQIHNTLILSTLLAHLVLFITMVFILSLVPLRLSFSYHLRLFLQHCCLYIFIWYTPNIQSQVFMLLYTSFGKSYRIPTLFPPETL